LACEGPEHARHFTVQVSLPSGQQFTATGTSCKKAEQEAARLALCALEARG
ncbi:MAG: putative dsRNA-binding protein, partial [Desulfovibrio sp.]